MNSFFHYAKGQISINRNRSQHRIPTETVVRASCQCASYLVCRPHRRESSLSHTSTLSYTYIICGATAAFCGGCTDGRQNVGRDATKCRVYPAFRRKLTAFYRPRTKCPPALRRFREGCLAPMQNAKPALQNANPQILRFNPQILRRLRQIPPILSLTSSTMLPRFLSIPSGVIPPGLSLTLLCCR